MDDEEWAADVEDGRQEALRRAAGHQLAALKGFRIASHRVAQTNITSSMREPLTRRRRAAAGALFLP
ncbi:hypothetical protein HPP92_021240 [Vanilla planifolia]|uniref:Uncharacterized protein n=1 Tax=Vanilla planifolia TaxID=51239 RepID=A0A835Q481_VANPL|nr:hypothetical protein HPP92_021240 [Vanilla planifolia]